MVGVVDEVVGVVVEGTEVAGTVVELTVLPGAAGTVEVDDVVCARASP